ncbi:MAG: 5,6-dimethylbenzimidazole synthase [Acetobacteraceae bacterium]
MSSMAFSADFTQELDQLLRWRRDVRHFQQQSVPEPVLEALLHRASMGPSVGLSQSWRFIRVEDAECRLAIHREFERCNRAARAELPARDAEEYARLKLNGLKDAPHHIAVFFVPEPTQGRGLGRRTMPQTVEWSVVMAIYNFWLAATVRGIGVGWVSILDPAITGQILEVDPGWEMMAYLCVGYPKSLSETPELEEKN